MAAIFLDSQRMIPYLVCEFSKPTLSNLVKECFGDEFPDILQKLQIHYIYQYLKDLGARSILLEFDYVDKDYLEDYSRYYVKRFSNAGHKCARLHFFSAEIEHAKLNKILINDKCELVADDLNRAYLGFMVVKPLPKTFIGKTCLKRYPEKNPDAKRTLLSRTYTANLFGITLEVESIAFQEQDKVVSACATASIWTALNSISWRNVREIHACSVITTNAINFIEGSSNGFPNKELSNKQILRALDVENLRHHSETLTESTKQDFIESVRSIINSQLPLILGADVYGISEAQGLIKKAGHAVTVLGYRFNAEEQIVYLHDDRLGPYARAAFVELSNHTFNSEEDRQRFSYDGAWGLTLQEKDDTGAWKDPHEILIPYSSIVPTHQKVRLPSKFAKNTFKHIVSEYHRWLAEKGPAEFQSGTPPLRFELKLSEISSIRKEILESPLITTFPNKGLTQTLPEADVEQLKSDRIAFLTKSLARFQWVGNFYFNDELAFRVLVDATDIPQGNAVSAVFVENKKLADGVLTYFREVAPTVSSDPDPEEELEKFYVSFLRRLKRPEKSLMEHLDKTYGELRAPSYIKAAEIAGGDVNHNDTTMCLYEATKVSLDSIYPHIATDGSADPLIWAISHEGALLIAEEKSHQGHPCITGMKPARISGELLRTNTGWVINSKSGRYSKDYQNTGELLINVLEKFKAIFPLSASSLHADNQAGKT
jgi:hypothetical protein